MGSNVALQAASWYHRGMNIVDPGSAKNTPGPIRYNLSKRSYHEYHSIPKLSTLQAQPSCFPLLIWRKDIMISKDPEKAALQRQKLSEAAKRRAARPGERELRSERTKVQMARPGMREQKSQSSLEWFANPENRQYNLEQKRASLGPEYSQHMSEAAKKRDARPGVRERKSEQQKEVMARPGIRERLSEATKAQFADPEFRQFNTERKIEALSKPEYRQKRSEIAKAQIRTPESETKRIEASRTPEARAKHIEAQQKRWTSEEEHQKMSDATKAAMARPDVMENYVKAMAIVHSKNGRTSIEVFIAELLDALEIEYESQKPIGRFVVDFFIPGKQLVVECDGDYWHSLPKTIERDARKDAFLTSKGYNVLRIPEHKIRKNDLLDFIEVIAS